MIIELPKKFSFIDRVNGIKIAWVENNMLYIKINADFDKIMHEVTYATKEKRYCYYCRREIPKTKVTLDHVYPKAYGGPTIPNNLVPTCVNCNAEKSNLNAAEYAIYTALDRKKRRSFLENTLHKKEQLRKEVGYDFPKELVTTVKTFKIKAVKGNGEKKKRYLKVEKQYLSYGTFRRPIVTDKNLRILDGYSVYLYASENNITDLPVIILKNVEIVY